MPSLALSLQAESESWLAASPNQQYVLVKGLHFIQEDSPNEIGQAINNWLEQLLISRS
jgi:hypothetical protein